jgi:hypothetical protein
MKRNLILTAAVLITVMLTTGFLSYAKPKSTDPNVKEKNAIENLKNGIRSNNEGLKRSSIYFAGYYRISETVPVLTETLKNESAPGTKILIALVLYRIGDEKGINLVKDMASKDKNPEVRRMCSCIYNAYKSGNSDDLALTGLK